jgi:hypothetical protein
MKKRAATAALFLFTISLKQNTTSEKLYINY